MERLRNSELYSEVISHSKAIASGAELPFFLSGNPTNEAVFSRLNRVEQLLHLIAIEVAAALPMELRYPTVTDPFFGDRLKERAEEVLNRNIQDEVWAF